MSLFFLHHQQQPMCFGRHCLTILCFRRLNVVSEVVQTLQLCADRDQSDVVGDLSVCLDGMTVDPEMFATAEADHHSESRQNNEFNLCVRKEEMNTFMHGFLFIQ